jgi:hypothetical protein
MPSVSRLEDVFAGKGWIINNWYIDTRTRMYSYALVTHLYRGCELMVEIGKKYSCGEDPTRASTNRILTPQANSGDLSLAGDQKYGELDSLSSALESENTLLESYSRPLNLIGSTSLPSKLRELYRQAQRFSFSFKNVEYKFALFNCGELVIFTPKNEIASFQISGINDCSKFVILTTLSNLFTSGTIVDDVAKLTSQWNSLLNTKQDEQVVAIQRLFTQNLNVPKISGEILMKKSKLQERLIKLQTLFDKITEEEKTVLTKVKALESKDIGRSDNDRISRIKERESMNKELERIQKIRTTVLGDISTVNKSIQHLYLLTDQVLFDSLLMLNRIASNIELLEKAV